MWHTLKRCFSAPHARLGWLMVFIGAIAWQFFGRHADWKSLRFLAATCQQTDGVVISTTPSGYTIGDEIGGNRIYSVRFRFKDPGGVQRRDVSWSEQKPGRPGTKIQVEFITADPIVARIVDLRSGMLPLWAGVVLCFPLFGVVCRVTTILGSPEVTLANGNKVDQ